MFEYNKKLKMYWADILYQIKNNKLKEIHENIFHEFLYYGYINEDVKDFSISVYSMKSRVVTQKEREEEDRKLNLPIVDYNEYNEFYIHEKYNERTKSFTITKKGLRLIEKYPDMRNMSFIDRHKLLISLSFKPQKMDFNFGQLFFVFGFIGLIIGVIFSIPLPYNFFFLVIIFCLIVIAAASWNSSNE
jgi:hypothetical protein